MAPGISSLLLFRVDGRTRDKIGGIYDRFAHLDERREHLISWSDALLDVGMILPSFESIKSSRNQTSTGVSVP